MKNWNSYKGIVIVESVIGDNGKILGEPYFEDAMKHAIATSSEGELVLGKFSNTDGFGGCIVDNKPVYVLHECKANIKAKTEKGYTTCLLKALLQDIGYMFRIKHGKIKDIPTEIKKQAEGSVYDFITEHLKLFLITNEVFVSHVIVDECCKQLLDMLEPIIINSKKSPSRLWEVPELREIMRAFPVKRYPYTKMEDYDVSFTGIIINNIDTLIEGQTH